MNGKILEEVYDRNAPYSEQIRIPFLFQGQYYDHETELAYNRFRYYSPELGRYISEDPIGAADQIASQAPRGQKKKTFLQESEVRVKDSVRNNPDLLRKTGWIYMKWWQIQFPEEETSSTPLAISPDGKKTLVDWMEAIESNRRFPFQYRLSPKMSLDDYIADDLGVPLFSEQVRNIIDELMTGEEGIEWYEVSVVQSRNQYRYFAPKFTRTLDILNEDSSLYGVNKSILIKAVLSAEKIKRYSIVPIVGSSEAFFFPTRIAISDRVKKALKKARVSGISFSPIRVD